MLTGSHNDGSRDQGRQRWECRWCIHFLAGQPCANPAEKLERGECRTCKAAAFKQSAYPKVPSVRKSGGAASRNNVEVTKLKQQLQLAQTRLAQGKKNKSSDMQVDGAPPASATQKERLVAVDGSLESIKKDAGEPEKASRASLEAEKGQTIAELRGRQPLRQQLAGLNEKLARTAGKVEKSEKTVVARGQRSAELQQEIVDDQKVLAQLRQQVLDAGQKIREVGTGAAQPPAAP